MKDKFYNPSSPHFQMRKEGITRLLVVVIAVGILLSSGVVYLMQDRPVYYSPDPNRPPIIEDISNQIFVCEGEALAYEFNAGDPDEDALEFDIYPKYQDPFFVRRTLINQSITKAEIYSGNLTKDEVGKDFMETILVTDGLQTETAATTITVIEINNPPVLKNIGVRTVSLDKSDHTFKEQALALDVETGDYNSGNLEFSTLFLSEETLFGIDRFGIMSFLPDKTHVGVHEIRVCVSDKALENPHQNIDICAQDGGIQVVCDEFELTITQKNSPPTIPSFFPERQNLKGSGSTNLYFNISKFDPDETTPDTSWYADNILIEYDSGEEAAELNYAFGCGVSGPHTIKAEITDGILIDSITWNVTLEHIECPEGIPTGTDVTANLCEEKWACHDWDLCQHAEQSFDFGTLENSLYQEIKSECSRNGWGTENCGFQVRPCFDLNECKTTVKKLPEVHSCYFTLAPSCKDTVRNCHDGSCEFLIDCGGPCPSCPTCSDGIQNQDEESVDCGGSCFNECQIEETFFEKDKVKYTIMIAFAVAVLLLILLLSRITKIKKRLQAPSKHDRISKDKSGVVAVNIALLAIFISPLLISGVSAFEYEEVSPITGLVSRCFPNYVCDSWEECIDGLQSRYCEDVTCGRRDIVERRFCSKPGCQPKIECLGWSECIYTEKIDDFINGQVGFGGYHNRLCRDANDCVESFTEEKACEEYYSLEMERVEQCGKDFLVAVDPSSERQVAKIDLESWQEDKLDITLVQGDQVYCPSCYNGAQDADEEGLDCGGLCKPCTKNFVAPKTLISIAFWLISALFSLLFVREILYMKKTHTLTYKNLIK